MAEVLIHTIEFLDDNTYGTFVSGDILTVYIDDAIVSTPAYNAIDAIKVYLNGGPILSGPLITTTLRSISLSRTNTTFCNSTYLISSDVQYEYPYGNYSTDADHPSCAAVPIVCDLIVIGKPEVINATGDTNTDGQITVTATSSNTIQYSLGPFNYGAGQATGVFTNLIPGIYRVYLVDSKSCKTDVLVEVGVTYTYGDRFILEYTDLKGFETKILVTKKSYSGTLTEVCGGAVPFELKLRGNGSDNKFEPLLATQGNLSLLSISDLQFLELYTNDPDLYRLEYYKDFGSGYEQYSTLKIIPQIYQEDYKFPPYIVDISATDGLPELKNFFLIQKDGQAYHGTISLIKLVSILLSPLKLDLNILVACNLYASGMDSTDADDPFDQAYVDFELFYIQNDLPSYDFVLQSILEPFGCRIVQWENRWNIIRVEELRADFDYRIFDSSGDYVSNGTYSPVQSIGSDVVFVNPDQNLEIRPGFGKILVNYLLGLKPNILDNGDFRLKSTFNPSDESYSYEVDLDGWTLVHSDYAIGEGFESIDTGIAYTLTSHILTADADVGGEAYILSDTYSIAMGLYNQLKISFRLKISGLYEAFFGTKFRSRLSYVKLRTVVQYGSSYLQGDGTWKSTYNEVIFYLTTSDQFEEFNIIAFQPTTGTPVDGQDFKITVFHPYPYHAQFQTVAALEAFPTYSGGDLIPTGYKTELRDVFSGLNPFYYFELEETTDANVSYYIIEPDDYHVTNNPRKWVRKNKANTGIAEYTVAFDFIKVQFLYNKELPFDTITRSASGESGNSLILDKTLIVGSSSNLVTTETIVSSTITERNRNAFKSVSITSQLVTTNILSYELIYAGYLRDASGNGYENWTRDGYTESDLLHGIFLQQYAGQYKRSWRLLRASIRNKNSFFGLLNTISEAGFVYLPISLSMDDKNCITNGEFLELMDSNPASTNSGFTTGFKQIAVR